MTNRPPHADSIERNHDRTHDDHEITPNMLDRLVKYFVVEATCPDCGRRGCFISSPGRNIDVNCKEPTCTEVFLL